MIGIRLNVQLFSLTRIPRSSLREKCGELYSLNTADAGSNVGVVSGDRQQPLHSTSEATSSSAAVAAAFAPPPSPPLLHPPHASHPLHPLSPPAHLAESGNEAHPIVTSAGSSLERGGEGDVPSNDSARGENQPKDPENNHKVYSRIRLCVTNYGKTKKKCFVLFTLLIQY